MTQPICDECIFFSSEDSTHCKILGYATPNGRSPIGFCDRFDPKPSVQLTSAEKKETNPKDVIRKFDTGATRDTVEGKLSYVKALSPIVLQRYVQYLNVHRKQPDGSLRDFDNWKQGIPIDAYFDGLGRHFVAAWLLEQGFTAEDNHGPVMLEDTLCAIIFNASGWLHELLKEELEDVARQD